MSYLTAFNTQVENFAKELGNLYPNDKDIDFAITSLSLLKKTNPRKIHDLIMSSMKSYRTQIFAKDDKFFLDSLSFQYTNYILSDSLWISRNNLKSKVRFLNQNNFDNYIKKSILFKIEDTLGVYLFLVKEILKKGDMAPLEVTYPTIKNIIINQTKGW